MTESIDNLQRKIKQAGDVGAVVRTMKAIKSSNIGQYQKAVAALDAYYKNILSGIHVYLRHQTPPTTFPASSEGTLFIVFGSDQGLVGSFNHAVARFSMEAMSKGERN